MTTKLFQTLSCAGAMLLCSTALHAVPPQEKILRTVRLSASASLVVKQVKEPAPPPKGTPSPLAPGEVLLDPSSPLGRSVNVTFTLIFKQGKKEVVVDQFEFLNADLPQGLGQSGFALYDAALDGENLLCTFVYKNQMILATAHVDPSGNVSGYQRGTILGRVEQIENASFSKDKDGKVTLKTKEQSPKGRAFQFDRNGAAFGVPADE